MVRIRLIRLMVATLVVAGAAIASASTQLWDKRTHFTFSGPVAVPGVTLQAGTYAFRLVETSSRSVIQVLSAKGDRSYAMFFGLPARRADIPDGPELRFMETAEGVPAAIESWWYPGTRAGYEFVYPKEQARLLASGLGAPVLTTVEETVAPVETGEGQWTRVTPFEEELAYEPAPMASQEPAAETLPRTAGSLPTGLLAGLALLLAAAALRVFGPDVV